MTIQSVYSLLWGRNWNASSWHRKCPICFSLSWSKLQRRRH